MAVTAHGGHQRKTRSHRNTLANVRTIEQPAKTGLHSGKRESDGRGQQEGHMQGIGKSLLIFGIVRALRIKRRVRNIRFGSRA